MGSGKQLVVNLSGEQKKVLGFASWKQVNISAAGLILGVIVFTVIKVLLSLIGTSTAASVFIAFVFMALVTGPFVFVAFYPIRDKDGNLLYYMSKQLQIDHNFERREVGTYLNLHENNHAVNQRFHYARILEEDDDLDDEESTAT